MGRLRSSDDSCEDTDEEHKSRRCQVKSISLRIDKLVIPCTCTPEKVAEKSRHQHRNSTHNKKESNVRTHKHRSSRHSQVEPSHEFCEKYCGDKKSRHDHRDVMRERFRGGFHIMRATQTTQTPPFIELKPPQQSVQASKHQSTFESDLSIMSPLWNTVESELTIHPSIRKHSERRANCPSPPASVLKRNIGVQSVPLTRTALSQVSESDILIAHQIYMDKSSSFDPNNLSWEPTNFELQPSTTAFDPFPHSVAQTFRKSDVSTVPISQVTSQKATSMATEPSARKVSSVSAHPNNENAHVFLAAPSARIVGDRSNRNVPSVIAAPSAIKGSNMIGTPSNQLAPVFVASRANKYPSVIEAPSGTPIHNMTKKSDIDSSHLEYKKPIVDDRSNRNVSSVKAAPSVRKDTSIIGGPENAVAPSVIGTPSAKKGSDIAGLPSNRLEPNSVASRAKDPSVTRAPSASAAPTMRKESNVADNPHLVSGKLALPFEQPMASAAKKLPKQSDYGYEYGSEYYYGYEEMPVDQLAAQQSAVVNKQLLQLKNKQASNAG